MTQGFDVRASARYVPISPQKARLVLDLVRGNDVVEAMDVLKFSQKAAAREVFKLVRSAVANAEENFGLNREDLFIHQIYADKGPVRFWRRFGARGRFKRIHRRFSHITVVLREHELETA
jgi:large subunit ribosomal protein L22